MFLDLFLAGFGILLAIVGTYDAVNKYNYPDPNHPHVPPIPIANSHLVQTAAANSMNSIGSWKKMLLLFTLFHHTMSNLPTFH